MSPNSAIAIVPAEVAYHMAKKLQAARNTRPLTAAARNTHPVLVAKPNTSSDNGDMSDKNGTSATAVAPMPRRTAPVASTRSMPTKAKTPTTPTTPARAAAAFKAGRASTRAAGQSMLRRTTIRAENFTYVLKDLRLIAIIAVVMVIILVTLHFILPA